MDAKERNTNSFWSGKDQTKILPTFSSSLLKLISASEPQRVLDVTCGPAGTCAIHFCSAGNRVISLDLKLSVAKDLQTLLRESEPLYDLSILVADVGHLPFADYSFDIITGVGALSNFDDPEKALKEMIRVLAPEGRIAIGDFMIPASAQEVYGLITTFRLGGRRPYLDYYQFQALLRSVGLVVTAYKSIMWLSPLTRSAKGAKKNKVPGYFYVEALLSVDPLTKRALGLHQRNGQWYRTNHSFVLLAQRENEVSDSEVYLAVDDHPRPASKTSETRGNG